MSVEFDWKFIKDAIDMDEWKHSIHLPEGDEEKARKCVNIMVVKIFDREKEIRQLKRALAMCEDRYGELWK